MVAVHRFRNIAPSVRSWANADLRPADRCLRRNTKLVP
jgi:hypothetical protein